MLATLTVILSSVLIGSLGLGVAGYFDVRRRGLTPR